MNNEKNTTKKNSCNLKKDLNGHTKANAEDPERVNGGFHSSTPETFKTDGED